MEIHVHYHALMENSQMQISYVNLAQTVAQHAIPSYIVLHANLIIIIITISVTMVV